MTSNLQRVLSALQDVVCRAEHDEKLLQSYFSTDYQQRVDGIELDYAGFVNHMATVKQDTSAITLNVLAAAVNNEQVLTHHRVTVAKQNGAVSVIEVHAHFTVHEGLICRCEELTRLDSGDINDRDLGSRLSNFHANENDVVFRI